MFGWSLQKGLAAARDESVVVTDYVRWATARGLPTSKLACNVP